MGGLVAKIIHKTDVEFVETCVDRLWDSVVTDIDMKEWRLGDLVAGSKVVLFVNVATK